MVFALTRQAYRAGVAIYAECGGLMYLGEQLIDQQGLLRAVGVVVAHGGAPFKSVCRWVHSRSVRPRSQAGSAYFLNNFSAGVACAGHC